jgi:hypothetical protein
VLAPPVLIDGSVVGERGLDDNGGVVWGSGTSAVTQFPGAEVDDDLVALARSAGNVRSSGDVEVAVVPIGDGSVGEIQVLVLDAEFGCERQYFVGPGVTLGEALVFAQSFADRI